MQRRQLLLALGAAPFAAEAQPRAASAPADPRAPLQLALPAGSAPADVDEGSIQFIGTATVILRYAGFTILTDPNFLHRGEHAKLGYGLRSRRLTEPAITLEQLPPIDLVVLSHYHGDHFDERVQKGLDRNVPIVSTPHAVRHLRKLGFKATYAIERWQALEVTKGDQRLRVVAMPGRHGPAGVSLALPPVMGSLLEFGAADGSPARWRLYITGDTLIHADLFDIPKRYPDIDMALLHLGGTRIGGILVTMDAKQGVEAMHIVNPGRAIPIHYDDYTVFKSPLDDFLVAARNAGLADRVTVLARGDTYRFQPKRR